MSKTVNFDKNGGYTFGDLKNMDVEGTGETQQTRPVSQSDKSSVRVQSMHKSFDLSAIKKKAGISTAKKETKTEKVAPTPVEEVKEVKKNSVSEAAIVPSKEEPATPAEPPKEYASVKLPKRGVKKNNDVEEPTSAVIIEEKPKPTEFELNTVAVEAQAPAEDEVPSAERTAISEMNLDMVAPTPAEEQSDFEPEPEPEPEPELVKEEPDQVGFMNLESVSHPAVAEAVSTPAEPEVPGQVVQFEITPLNDILKLANTSVSELAPWILSVAKAYATRPDAIFENPQFAPLRAYSAVITSAKSAPIIAIGFDKKISACTYKQGGLVDKSKDITIDGTCACINWNPVASTSQRNIAGVVL